MNKILTITLLLLTLNLSAQIDTIHTYPRKDTVIVLVQPQPQQIDAGKIVASVLISTIVVSVISYAVPFLLTRR